MSNSSPPSGLSSLRASRLWLAATLAVVILAAIPNISYPIGRDQATFAVLGRGILHGKALYRNLWDNKPPGIFFIFALIVRIFGQKMLSVGLVDILWLAAISFLIFRFAERTMGSAAGFLAALANAVWHLRAGYWDAAQAETFLMACIFASYFLMGDKRKPSFFRALASGMFFSAAFWIKYNAVAFLPLVLVAPFLEWPSRMELPSGGGPSFRLTRLKWLTCLGEFALGACTLSAAVLGYFALSHSWPAFWQENTQVLPRYAEAALTHSSIGRLWAIGKWLGWWSIAAALVAPLVAWKRRQPYRLAPAWIGAASGFLALAIQVRFQPYYFETCYPFFAMIWGYLGMEIYAGAQGLASVFRRRGWKLASPLVWLAFADLVALTLPGPVMRVAANYKAFGEWLHGPEPFYANYAWPGPAEDFHDLLRVVEFLRRHPAPPTGVYVWGNEPLIYFLSDHEPPTRFVWNLALIATWRLPGWRRELLRDLNTARPLYIIVARHDAVPALSASGKRTRLAWIHRPDRPLSG